jgi:hypothetical protein
MIFIGISTLLRILLSARTSHSLAAWVGAKLFWGLFFLGMYGTLLMFIIAFTLSGIDFEKLSLSFEGIKPAVWLLGGNHLAGLTFGFLMNGAYKKSSPLKEVFSTLIYALPVVMILLFAITPLTIKVGSSHQNATLAGGVVLLRLFMDVMAVRLRGLVHSIAP